MWTRLLSLLIAFGLPTPVVAQAAPAFSELRVWTARAIATVLWEVGSEFERTAGVRLQITTGLPLDFERRFASGERFDLLISGSAPIGEWIRSGRLIDSTRVALARSGIGIAVKQGSPKPDLTTVDAFRTALLNAKSLAYLRVGSGLYLDSLLQRLDLRDALKAKTLRPVGDSVVLLVAQGQVELGLVVITQILTTPGVELAGPLPSAVQSHMTFAAAVGTQARDPDAARQLIRFLEGPVATRVMRAQGMERPRP